MNSSRYKRNQWKYLASLIGVPTSRLQFVIENLGDHYYEWKRVKVDQLSGQPKTYSNGTEKVRILTPPKGTLKIIQERIKSRLLSKVDYPIYLNGGLKGRSNITNAKAHKGKKYRFTTDIKDFFPSVRPSLVYSAFASLGYSHYVSNWLTKLTTWNFGLPQGASTSSYLANLAFQPIDLRILEICSKYGITYTRFIDDLTFSSSKDFREIIPQLLETLSDSGFQVSHRKTSYGHISTVTGIIVKNNYIDAPDWIKAKLTKEKDAEGPLTNYVNRIQNELV